MHVLCGITTAQAVLSSISQVPICSRATFADALQVSAAAAVNALGGPRCSMLMGRPDVAVADFVSSDLPNECDTADAQISKFAVMGFRDPAKTVTTLSGAHNIGFSRAAAANPEFASCRLSNDGQVNSLTVQPTTFDGHYYTEVVQQVGKGGWFNSDRNLNVAGVPTASLMQTYSANHTTFLDSWCEFFKEMSLLGVDVETNGFNISDGWLPDLSVTIQSVIAASTNPPPPSSSPQPPSPNPNPLSLSPPLPSPFPAPSPITPQVSPSPPSPLSPSSQAGSPTTSPSLMSPSSADSGGSSTIIPDTPLPASSSSPQTFTCQARIVPTSSQVWLTGAQQATMGINIFWSSVGDGIVIPAGWSFTLSSSQYTGSTGTPWGLQTLSFSGVSFSGQSNGDRTTTPWFSLVSSGAEYNMGWFVTLQSMTSNYFPTSASVNGNPCLLVADGFPPPLPAPALSTQPAVSTSQSGGSGVTCQVQVVPTANQPWMTSEGSTMGLNMFFFSVGNIVIPAGWNFTLFNHGYTSILTGQTWNFNLDSLSEGLVIGHGIGDSSTPWFHLVSTGSGYNLGLILTSSGGFTPTEVNVNGMPCTISVPVS
ncbi:hypothetical protein CEUSTIGMA_g4942.t1 [Chlamydomonas eustigma]|uniref:Plant heme peroxidase family profile domain-containing protein n=1 Tax=Chlamydomonas eustigma TaxID=1157962 RepID=A0A250X351_9CHLO|nr:hypothetical protein CEUSTIGMA_g4942.t1 [Chlamydomonas eustigma]|eukprot:GAX77498.1 hypothetical protein CEUSTIGMA_g4942.t1 [Chlamydomonas eustigma]